MNPDLYYDPTWGLAEWQASFFCEPCKADTDHVFMKKWGVTTGVCESCGNEVEIDPEDYLDV